MVAAFFVKTSQTNLRPPWEQGLLANVVVFRAFHGSKRSLVSGRLMVARHSPSRLLCLAAHGEAAIARYLTGLVGLRIMCVSAPVHTET